MQSDEKCENIRSEKMLFCYFLRKREKLTESCCSCIISLEEWLVSMLDPICPDWAEQMQPWLAELPLIW